MVAVVFYSGFWNWQCRENYPILHLKQSMLKNPSKVLHKISGQSNSAIVLQRVLEELFQGKSCWCTSGLKIRHIFPMHSLAISLYWSHQQWPHSYFLFCMISIIGDISSINFSMFSLLLLSWGGLYMFPMVNVLLKLCPLTSMKDLPTHPTCHINFAVYTSIFY